MKCCKSCTDKKGIKCLGGHKIIKHEGYKFCSSYNPKANEISKRLLSIARKIEFNKRINYYSPAAKEAAIDVIKKEVEPEIRQAVQTTMKGFKKFIHTLGKAVIDLASKAKEVQETH